MPFARSSEDTYQPTNWPTDKPINITQRSKNGADTDVCGRTQAHGGCHPLRHHRDDLHGQSRSPRRVAFRNGHCDRAVFQIDARRSSESQMAGAGPFHFVQRPCLPGLVCRIGRARFLRQIASEHTAPPGQHPAGPPGHEQGARHRHDHRIPRARPFGRHRYGAGRPASEERLSRLGDHR